jgi:hypothetical protein
MFESLDKYKEQYSKYLDLAVKLHNYHMIFSQHWGDESGRILRRTIREMRKVETELLNLSRVAQKEYKVTRRELAKKAREQTIAWQKANPRRRGRPKGNKNNVKHNGTNENSP